MQSNPNLITKPHPMSILRCLDERYFRGKNAVQNSNSTPSEKS